MTHKHPSIVKSILAILVLSAAFISVGTKNAEAHSTNYGTLVGTVVKSSDNTRVPGAAIWLYRQDGSSWTSLGRIATSNSSGNYATTVALGNVYAVIAVKNYGACFMGTGITQYQGNSPAFLDNLALANASVRISYAGWINC